MTHRPRIGLLFNHDWDALGHARQASAWRFDSAGFDLFSFPSNAQLALFDLRRFAAAQARRGRRRGWVGVTSQHEQFGTLAAALTAEALGLPGTRPEAVLAAQHKLHAREVLERVAPEANLRFAPLNAEYGDDIPDGLAYPCFAKPVKAAKVAKVVAPPPPSGVRHPSRRWGRCPGSGSCACLRRCSRTASRVSHP